MVNKINWLQITGRVDRARHGSEHQQMIDEAPKTDFQTRFDAVLKHLRLRNRAGFARLLGIPEKSARSTSFNWYYRAAIPLKNRDALARLGISIDFVNEGIGDMLISQTDPSSAAGEHLTETVMRTHAFLAQGEDPSYNLGDRSAAETFATAYKWILAKVEQGDQSPDTVFNFLQWQRQQTPAQLALRHDIDAWEKHDAAEPTQVQPPLVVNKKSTKR